MRNTKRACWERAKSQASSAVRRLPICNGPDGLGAKRPSGERTRGASHTARAAPLQSLAMRGMGSGASERGGSGAAA